jgi:hypothetical protein
MQKREQASEVDPRRREMLRATGATVVAGLAAAALPGALPAAAQGRDPATVARLAPGSLGARLQGVQHFGVTVQNMDRALLTDEEIVARERKVNPRTRGIPDLRGGAQRLDVRFVQFDNVVIELLQYRDADQPMGSGNSFAEPRDHMSPAYPRSMHICFYLRDDVDFNAFIRDLEAESARRGMTQVKANRVITATSEQQRQAAPLDANSNRITQGQSDGWSLIYCKGPEGEQLEFVQALGAVKRTFQNAFQARQSLISGTRG